MPGASTCATEVRLRLSGTTRGSVQQRFGAADRWAPGGPVVARRIPRSALERFGTERLRSGQRRAIEGLLEGRNVVTLLPTAAGEALTYQVTSQLLPASTIVVQPLLALIRDQLRSLSAQGVPAAELTGRQSTRAVDRILADVA